MYQLQKRFLVIISILVIAITNVNSQTTMPEELTKSPLKDQIKYLEDHTRIYEFYRAIREDMFQKIKVNISDTLILTKNKITGLNIKTLSLGQKIDSLKTSLEATKKSLDEMTSSKNSIRVIGIEVNKVTYNTTMWTIIFGLIAVLAIGFFLFKRNRSVTINTTEELQSLKNEFEAYRKSTREAREKASMAHFLEIKKLKGE